jgi:hypothetical protein
MPRSSRRLLPVAVAALAVLLSGCGTEPARPSGTADPPPSETVRLSYAGGQAGGDTGRVEVRVGTTVSLVVDGDTADTVHVHGYDRYLDVPAGGSATLSFVADVSGVFDVELHDQGVLLTQLLVKPA